MCNCSDKYLVEYIMSTSGGGLKSEIVKALDKRDAQKKFNKKMRKENFRIVRITKMS